MYERIVSHTNVDRTISFMVKICVVQDDKMLN